MNIKKIAKLVGFLVGPIIPLVLAIYFLFPYLNEEQYQQVNEKYKHNYSQIDSTNANIQMIPQDYQTLKEQAENLLTTIDELNVQVDSMKVLEDSLSKQLTAKEELINELQNDTSSNESEQTVSTVNVNSEKFTESAESLLGLDDDELSPILQEMTDGQLIRLFEGGNSLQKKKLLRSLESKRAANLMSKVMQ